MKHLATHLLLALIPLLGTQGACKKALVTVRKVESRTAQGEGVNLVEIRNLSGNVEIIAYRHLVQELQVTATFQASATSKAKAKAALKRMTLRIHRDGNRAMVVVQHPKDKATGRYAVRLRLLLPADTRVDADTGKGGIRLMGMSGTITARTAKGDIEVTNASQATRLETQEGAVRLSGNVPSFDVKSGRGDVTVTVHEHSSLKEASSVTASDGRVTLSLNEKFHAKLSAQVADLVLITPTPGITRQGSVYTGTLGDGGKLLSISAPKGELRLVRRPYIKMRVTPTFQDEEREKKLREKKRQQDEAQRLKESSGAPDPKPHPLPHPHSH